MTDCTQANQFISDLIFLFQEAHVLFTIYPTLWGIVLIRKIFYA